MYYTLLTDKYHSDHNDTLKMNLGIEIQYTLAYFIGFMLQSICYGKHRPPTPFGSDNNGALTFMRRLIPYIYLAR